MIFTETAYGLPRQTIEGLFDIEARLPRTVAEIPTAKTQSLKTESATAVIAVDGVLFPKPNLLTWFGFGSALSDIQFSLNAAAADPQVKKIILNFSSPGGSVTGVNELANHIKAISKPTVAYVSGMACSAAYWLAAACDEIVIDATATLGSIGVVGIYGKPSKNEVEIVSSAAPDKRPNIETDEGRKVLLAHIDSLEQVFITSLTKLRPGLTADAIKALRGGVRVGEKAIQAGLADGLGSLQTVLRGQAPIKPEIAAVANDEQSVMDGWQKAANRIKAMNAAKTGQADINDQVSDSGKSANSGWKSAAEKVNAMNRAR
ncbi:S49 family peptidase [Methylomonas sp. MgM2]